MLPLTTARKGYRFEVIVDPALPSIALADQIKSVDWRLRHADFKGRLTGEQLDAVRAKAMLLLSGS